MNMVANFNDHIEVEHFLRDANAAELNAERAYLQNLLVSVTPLLLQQIVWTLDARIAYELRFRVPQFC